MVVTKSGSTVTFYVDGVAAAADASYDPGFEFTSNAYLGFFGSGGGNFFGILDEVEIFNRALTSDEVQAIYDAGSAGKCRTCAPQPSNMVAWWKAENNFNDSIGSNDGTQQNGVTFAPGEVNQAFILNGNNQYVLIGDPVPADPDRTRRRVHARGVVPSCRGLHRVQ